MFKHSQSSFDESNLLVFSSQCQNKNFALNDTKNYWQTRYGQIYNSNRFIVNFSPWCLSLKNPYGLLSLEIDWNFQNCELGKIKVALNLLYNFFKLWEELHLNLVFERSILVVHYYI